MANILDYLDWRGDLTLRQDPFNEVDNLLLSELAFVDFRGIVPAFTGVSVSLREAAESYFARFPRGEKIDMGVLIPDEPGGLDKVLRVLAGANINVEYMYAFLGGRNIHRACMIFRVGDARAAESALGTWGIKILSQDEIASF